MLRQQQRYFDVAQYKSVQVSRTLPTAQDWIIYLLEIPYGDVSLDMG
ncbi:hypothetical protein [Nostoc sp.]